jgi:hypothetical protein
MTAALNASTIHILVKPATTIRLARTGLFAPMACPTNAVAPLMAPSVRQKESTITFDAMTNTSFWSCGRMPDITVMRLNAAISPPTNGIDAKEVTMKTRQMSPRLEGKRPTPIQAGEASRPATNAVTVDADVNDEWVDAKKAGSVLRPSFSVDWKV